jgi:hypothetical protein
VRGKRTGTGGIIQFHDHPLRVRATCPVGSQLGHVRAQENSVGARSRCAVMQFCENFPSIHKNVI